jgi:hypothetical protein
MDSFPAGQLVRVAEDGPPRDGIIFDTPSAQKVVVAVMDRRRGPVFRTVHRRTLSDRTEAGPDDAALNRLIRRTPPPGRRGARAGSGTGRGQDGHTRAAMHRTTGK